eukprot:g8045.t1
MEHLRQRIQNNIYDVSAWEQLISILRAAPSSTQYFTDLKEAYERMLSVFPSAAGQWKAFAEAAMSTNDQTTTKSIFNRCLLLCPNVELWTTYLKFIRSINEESGIENIMEIRKALEFTLDRLGQDLNSGPIWQEYLNLLQNPKPGTPAYTALFSEDGAIGQEDSHRLVIIRKAFQRAVVVPTAHVEALWKSYENFEKSGANRTLSRKLVEDFRPRYLAAKRIFTERAKKLENIKLTKLALPPDHATPVFVEQYELWMQYLEFEKNNPQRIDPPVLTARVSLAYDQALQCLYHFPEVWTDYARFHLQTGNPSLAIKVLEKSTKCLPACVMLHFTLADLKEQDGHQDEAKEIYELLMQSLDLASSNPAHQPNPFLGTNLNQLTSLVWITYMRFLRRAVSVKASREMFVGISKSPNCTWEVYVAAAMLELRSKEQQVAVRIFERGMLQFLSCPEFVLEYVNFLLGIGDIENTRAVFERALSVEVCAQSQALWDKYITALYEIGDLDTAMLVEERKREALGDSLVNNFSSLIARYKIWDIWPFGDQGQIEHSRKILGLDVQTPTMPPRRQSSSTLQSNGGNGRPEIEVVKIPPVLNTFMNQLPQFEGSEGPVPDPNRPLQAMLKTDLSPAAIQSLLHNIQTVSVPPIRPTVAPVPMTNSMDEGSGVRKREMELDTTSVAMLAPSDVSDTYRTRMRRKLAGGGFPMDTTNTPPNVPEYHSLSTSL